jgi:hypothetical protein
MAIPAVVGPERSTLAVFTRSQSGLHAQPRFAQEVIQELPRVLHTVRRESLLTLNRRRSGKPPSVSFKIARTVLALPIRLIDRLRIDERTSGARPLIVSIDIIHVHEETRIRDVRDQRGIEPMFRRHAVKPNRGITRTDLAMDGLAFGVSIHATASEAEGIDEEIVSRRDVVVSQNRNDSLEIRHDVLPLSHVRLTGLRASQSRGHWDRLLFHSDIRVQLELPG